MTSVQKTNYNYDSPNCLLITNYFLKHQKENKLFLEYIDLIQKLNDLMNKLISEKRKEIQKDKKLLENYSKKIYYLNDLYQKNILNKKTVSLENIQVKEKIIEEIKKENKIEKSKQTILDESLNDNPIWIFKSFHSHFIKSSDILYSATATKTSAL